MKGLATQWPRFESRSGSQDFQMLDFTPTTNLKKNTCKVGTNIAMTWGNDDNREQLHLQH